MWATALKALACAGAGACVPPLVTAVKSLGWSTAKKFKKVEGYELSTKHALAEQEKFMDMGKYVRERDSYICNHYSKNYWFLDRADKETVDKLYPKEHYLTNTTQLNFFVMRKEALKMLKTKYTFVCALGSVYLYFLYPFLQRAASR